MDHKFSYNWRISDGYPATGIEAHHKKVFTTFACGGGSSMGYKLAGYDVVAANDIDPQMAKVYQQNHHPNQFFECPIGDLLKMDLSQYVGIDVLDGSPPCSTFSMAGSREKNWKKMKQFREGQAEQVLSDLFFDWIALVDKLKPKVAIAENVKGMLIGNAKLYTKRIVQKLNEIGYDAQIFLLNAASMGVPQRRERVFFICTRKELQFRARKVTMNFAEAPVNFSVIHDNDDTQCNLTPLYLKYWRDARPGDPVGKFQTHIKEEPNRPLKTIEASGAGGFSYLYPRTMNKKELCLAVSYPLDYDFMDVDPKYLIGMSVPPVMMANVANVVYEQILKWYTEPLSETKTT